MLPVRLHCYFGISLLFQMVFFLLKYVLEWTLQGHPLNDEFPQSLSKNVFTLIIFLNNYITVQGLGNYNLVAKHYFIIFCPLLLLRGIVLLLTGLWS